ncbi:MAG: hypothetical protein GPOALKHO_000863 [Sodalis sp.]|nr:MAG: hypothetical protein GPOALKHO_000863 [Sodalis sp.]
MVSNASALGRSGVHEWLLVRTSAIVICLYIIYLLGFILIADTFTYGVWRGFLLLPESLYSTNNPVFHPGVHLDRHVAGINGLHQAFGAATAAAIGYRYHINGYLLHVTLFTSCNCCGVGA